MPGFQPDPTICRVGRDYYLATSSFEYFPAVPIFHSTDLVAWEQIGHILDRPEQLGLSERTPSGGLYAGTLRHHAGTFYYVTSNASAHDAGPFIVTAADPAGPWSDPIHIPEAIGIDPDICWDEDGRCLLTWHVLDFVNGGQAVRQAHIDPATGRFHAPPVDVWQGSGLPAAESPHLYRIGDWWYQVLAEGGTERGHCVTVARARRPEGPFEGCPANPVFTRRSTFETVLNVGHADFVEAPGGGWAAVYLGVRSAGSTPGFHVLGRETFVAGIDWVDGWPEFDLDRYTVAPSERAFEDHFLTAELDLRWVVPTGDLTSIDVLTPGVRVPAGSRLCTRVQDLRWRAQAAIVKSGGFGLRIDPRHSYDLRLADGVVVAQATIGDVSALLAEFAVGGQDVVLSIEAVDPGTAAVPVGHAGPDDIVLSVVVEGETIELARLDGRYLSTEVASGFTGRVLALGSDRDATTVRNFTYSPTR
nr:glycoside hydrolase family 43 protein [Tessaracoccus sp. MC1627]